MRKIVSVFFLVIVAVIALSLSSCNKEADLLGIDLLPNGDKGKIQYMEYNILKGSLFTTDTLHYYPNLNIGLTGILNDPFFGQTESATLIQVVPYYLRMEYGSEPGTDSLIFSIFRDTIYGERNLPITFSLYMLNGPSEIINNDTLKYPVDMDPSGMIDPAPIAQTTVMPGDTAIRFHLGYALANKLISISKDTVITADRKLFLKEFPGFIMKAEPSGGVGFMQRINLQSAYTRLEHYYHVVNDTVQQVNTYFVTDDYSSGPAARFNFIHHDYSGTAFASQLNDTSYNLSRFYIQGMASIGLRLRLPFLDSWKERTDSAIAFQFVELELPADVQDYDTLLYRPSQIVIMRKDSTVFDDISDHPSTSSGNVWDPYNGKYQADSAVYRFVITHHCQAYVLGKQPNSDLYIVNNFPYYSTQQFERVMLMNEPEGKHIKLKITYSVYPKH